MIYLDNAATSLRRPEGVVRAVSEALCSLGNVGRGASESALSAARVVYAAREKLCAFFGGADPSRVCFTQNSTEALNTAIFGLLRPGDHVISTDLEHNSVLRPLYRLEQEGVEVTFLRADARGCIDYADLPRALRPNTRAIVCTHASNLTGNALDASRIGAFARGHGLLFILDASQTAGSFDLNAQRDGVSVLCFTGHKGMMGPQGTGGLIAAPGVEIRPLKTGGTGVQSYRREQPEEYPTRLESGTLNGHGIAGLSAALDFLQETGIGTIHAHETALLRRFVEGVRNIPGVTLYGNFDCERTAVAALNIGDMDSGEVSDILSEDYGIATRPGAHCAPRLHRALGTEGQGAVRFSFGWYNTEEEADAAVRAVREIAT